MARRHPLRPRRFCLTFLQKTERVFIFLNCVCLLVPPSHQHRRQRWAGKRWWRRGRRSVGRSSRIGLALPIAVIYDMDSLSTSGWMYLLGVLHDEAVLLRGIKEQDALPVRDEGFKKSYTHLSRYTGKSLWQLNLAKNNARSPHHTLQRYVASLCVFREFLLVFVFVTHVRECFSGVNFIMSTMDRIVS